MSRAEASEGERWRRPGLARVRVEEGWGWRRWGGGLGSGAGKGGELA